ncbi:MAG: DMT family transporter [Chloroflexi bacterium]|nr:DMT family transporter [Chloroflexota bacterium]
MSSDEPSQGGRLSGLAYVIAGVGLLATSPVLTRYAAPLSPIEITFWRLAIAGGAVLVAASLAGQIAQLSLAAAPRFLVYGLVAALHFLTYVASLSFTTIAHALAITYTAPVFVALFSAWVLGESLERRKYAGIALTVAGIGILAGFEPELSVGIVFGDLLALASAITFGVYSVMGRYERTRYSLLSYAGAVYTGAAIWLLPAALWQWTGAYEPRTVGSVLWLGLLPLALGHTLYNASLRRVHATYVNLIATQEVTGGILLGYLILGETPSLNSLLGAAVALVGIIFVLL